MVSTFTPNIQWEEPARGDDVGTWDTPVNANGTLIDLVTGAINTISLNNSPVILAAAQFQAKTITFNSTLTGSVTITFPTSFKKSYEIQNLCTGSSAFVITLATTAAAGQQICCPPGVIIECLNDGANLKFKNFGGPIGSYFDYAGSSNPTWNSCCTVPPYLNCDGSAIPVAYTVLPIILGSSLLPDSKGRSRFALDQGAGRISSAAFSGSSVGSAGGTQATTLSSIHVPPVKITDPGHVHTFPAGGPAGAGFPGQNTVGSFNQGGMSTAFTGITAGSSSPSSFNIVPPAYIGGLTMIRAG